MNLVLDPHWRPLADDDGLAVPRLVRSVRQQSGMVVARLVRPGSGNISITAQLYRNGEWNKVGDYSSPELAVSALVERYQRGD